MFEHFGIMDVFSSLKKYKVIISIVILLSIIFGVYRGLNKISSQGNSSKQDPRNTFEVSSASYMIEPKIKLDKDNTNIYREVPSQTAAVLATDFCKKYVFSELKNIYSSEEILENINYLDAGYDQPSDLDFDFLDDLFFAHQYENTMIIKLTAESHNKQFTKDLLDIYKSYLEKEYAPTVKDNVDIIYIDTVDQSINSNKSVVETLIEESKDSTGIVSTKHVTVNPIKVMIKAVLIPLILAVTLCLIVIFLITLFNPTLNRETDFLEYDVPIIGEVYVNKNFKGEKK